MDLSFYWWHVANHRIPFLWRFHNVHHIDPDLDVSTGFRFHFGEVAMSAAFRVVQVIFIGISGPENGPNKRRHPGGFALLDAKTGSLIKRVYTVSAAENARG